MIRRIHVVAVIGLLYPRYSLFGETVNTAAKLCSHSVPGEINISQDTYNALDAIAFGRYDMVLLIERM